MASNQASRGAARASSQASRGAANVQNNQNTNVNIDLRVTNAQNLNASQLAREIRKNVKQAFDQQMSRQYQDSVG
jgi:hypothetical protein